MRRIAKKILNRVGYDIKNISSAKTKPRKSGDSIIYFIHIGKNAGTQIHRLARQIEKLTAIKLIKTAHDFKFEDLPKNTSYFFSIRDPASRFKSGFGSRKRKGQPRLNSEWSRHEMTAFANFENANDLAESLFADGEIGRKAAQAIQSISHTAMHQIDWFAHHGDFLSQSPPIWIIRQENFEEDFEEFLTRAGLPLKISDLDITKDPVLSHSNDYSLVPSLSDLAIANLQKWYARDYEFYRICVDWMSDQKSRNN